MSDSNYGACIVAIPKANAFPNTVDGGQHITLMHISDDPLDEDLYQDTLDTVSAVASLYQGHIEVDTYDFDYFGKDGDAHVLRFESDPTSILVAIRNQLMDMLPSQVLDLFNANETFPIYNPHMTLGYISDGYEPPKDLLLPESLELEGLGVWNGGTRVTIKFKDSGPLVHYGILRRSGRYPWGSGKNAHQTNKQFLDYYKELVDAGVSETAIAKGLGLTKEEILAGKTAVKENQVSTTQLRAAKAIAKNEQRKADIATALKLHDKGYSNSAIARKMDRNESSIRAMLKPENQKKLDILETTANVLKEEVAAKKYLDVSAGTENWMGISQTKLATAVSMLREEGYTLHYINVPQLGTGEMTKMKVLAAPGVKYTEVSANREKIGTVAKYSENLGRTYLGIEPPTSVSSKRIAVRYGDEGGKDKDGVIEIRRGVPDLSLGDARYVQARIMVDGTHYLKGMVMYADDLPDGVDIRFNTNKLNTGNKLDAMKEIKSDPDNPFGAVIRQKHYADSSGKTKLSPINIVGTEDPDGKKTPGEEGGWSTWSKSLSSQMLSKQPVTLAKQQLALTYAIKKAEYDEIASLTNPTVKKALLIKFADGLDSSAVHLKAAGLPRTASHVILPINSLKDTEIYAPKYNNGEKVVLIRHPHGGTFEIPELTVNNRNKEANRLIKNAKDAVGINAKVAARLSGADFDGDTVLVIPNASHGPNKIKTASPLKQLENFDPQASYAPYDGMKTIDGGIYRASTGKVDYQGKKPNKTTKQTEMGKVSNLITDMTIKGATHSEIARAVKHSMVVIDAEKHSLDYKRSEIDNNIAQLKAKYQSKDDGKSGGASTLISRASSEIRVNEKKPRSAKDGGPIDKATGEKVYTETGRTYTDSKGKTIYAKTKSTQIAETNDARTLISKQATPIEVVYADHANKLKALANQARKEYLATPSLKYSPSAKKVYAAQVESLNAKLNVAQKNSPLERQAQLLANYIRDTKKQANPDMTAEEDKKVKSQALSEARLRIGAHKEKVDITDKEWEAIQAGAISENKLSAILANADLDRVKSLATPRDNPVMNSARLNRAKSMLSAGYTQAEIAAALGVSASTIDSALTSVGK